MRSLVERRRRPASRRRRPAGRRGGRRRRPPPATPPRTTPSLDHERAGDEREAVVAVARRDLLEAGAGARRIEREANLDQHLVRLQRRRQVRDEEVAGGDRAPPARGPPRRPTRRGRAGTAAARRPRPRARSSRRRCRGCASRRARRTAAPRPAGGSARARRGAAPARAARTSAPTRSSPSTASMIASRPATRLRSTTTAGAASRRLSSGTRLCPPARALASHPCSASRAAASATLAGRS